MWFIHGISVTIKNPLPLEYISQYTLSRIIQQSALQSEANYMNNATQLIFTHWYEIYPIKHYCHNLVFLSQYFKWTNLKYIRIYISVKHIYQKYHVIISVSHISNNSVHNRVVFMEALLFLMGRHLLCTSMY